MFPENGFISLQMSNCKLNGKVNQKNKNQSNHQILCTRAKKSLFRKPFACLWNLTTRKLSKVNNQTSPDVLAH